MSKYSYKFKVKIVEEYLNGSSGYSLLVQKYRVKNRASIQKWINHYQQYAVDGLRSKTNKRKYIFKFKLDVLKFKQDTGASYK